GNIRQAAADGFDVVYRRLWIYQLAMREALFIAGAVDAVQCLATTRHRRGGR
ncbi:cyclopropane-fatty-acyl-phospholipid synthase, partial [Corynebacterium diphtheriae DSM 43988]